MVEIDPQDPASTPRKRSALGRAAHEGAATALTDDGRAVIYMGEDSRFEYIYKFVSRDKVQPGGAAANRDLLDHGTLYVARFDVDGTGEWLALVQGRNGLVADKGFVTQGDVLIKARQASDLLGATKMDRPEWTTVDPLTKEVYCTLTNNSNRGGAGQPFMDAANPRSNNTMGQIIRWKESGDLDATRFAWNHLVLAGDPKQTRLRGAGQHQGRHLRQPRRPDGRCARRAVDRDRRVDLHAGQGRVRQPAEQPDAGLRPDEGRDPPLPAGARRLRDHGPHRHAGPAHAVHQHPASGRAGQRAQRPRASAGRVEVA